MTLSCLTSCPKQHLYYFIHILCARLAKSSLNKQKSCNDNASINLALGLETQLVRSQPRGWGKDHVSPWSLGARKGHVSALSLGAGTPSSRLLSRAQAIWLAVNLVKYTMVTNCFAALSIVKQGKIYCSHHRSKWNLHFSSSVSLLNIAEVSEGTWTSVCIYTNTSGDSCNHFTLNWWHNMVSCVHR